LAKDLKDGGDLRLCGSRHLMCKKRVFDYSLVPQVPQEYKLDLRFFRACRQAYIEASPILWKSTTWSFFNESSLYTFLKARTGVQRWHMRKLHLGIGACTMHLAPYIIERFQALEIVHMDIDDGNKTVVPPMLYRKL
jgi:hypothetical protein